ncbi:acid protease [Gymnopilus junonius]|uniref:Acid protease n=1 Tax=Gymnopilus junonius TaxID=109634 RepID=A0A9P5N755_GYMJU|nr:acid protease [Gymnopilus junonius]
MFSPALIITLLFQLHILFATANLVHRVDASAVTLPLARRVNITGAHDLIKHDKSRVKALRSRLQKTTKTADIFVVPNIPVTNQAITYTANVSVGNPAQFFSLIVDTGSSNTWVGAQDSNSYRFTSTTKFTGDLVQVTYGSGAFLGVEVSDTVTLAPGLVIPDQSVGVSILSYGFDDVDGIIGLGPTGLTTGTCTADLAGARYIDIHPTITDNLFNEKIIPERLVSIYFQPSDAASVQNGEMTFGGIDTTRNTSDFTWIPITNASKAGQYWGIDQSVAYGNTTILNITSGIVDTGTTLIYLSTDAYDRYMQATNATASDTGLLSLPVTQYSNLQSLFFNAGGTSFELTPNAQIWPRSLNTLIGGTSDFVYLMIADIGSVSGSGLDFINGYAFLERFYSVYDSTNKRVGLASTNYTNLEVN